MQWFDFSLPIGWEELSAIATAVAVIIALWSNKKVTLQMRDALRMQEQAKNVELFDKRVVMIRDIQENQRLSNLEVRFLFNENIALLHERLLELESEKKLFYKDLEIYKFLDADIAEIEGTSPSLPKIAKAKWIMEQLDYPQDKVKEYEDICNQTEIISDYDSDTGSAKTYNYKSIAESIDDAQRRIDRCKTELIEVMSNYVQASIQSLL